jgi:hypothetical protein
VIGFALTGDLMTGSSFPAVRRRILAARRSLAALDRSWKGIAISLRTLRDAPAAGKGPRRSVTLSPKARAALKLQGQYMGYMRQLGPRQKNVVRAVLAKSGKQAAIRKAQELAGKRKAA